ncbi:DUF3343 domain-containing protein [Treponema pedis]|uniref:DUF3343 domain-containing protein n=2 Tax=Treponema pedis TaxID=409322 RepID=A0A7S6WQM9_9SPIR|nr:DUF3343 domain-containing protein [Treponema pedis]AGT42926.1 hypothetical protein TPE_0430 [Treponema pedis str. T A4]QOW61548.1 DUF3343 domain-containing protein [Treponema pedis]
MKNHYLFFEDSKTAISFYSEIKKAGVKCTMAPTPRAAGACCGVSILYYNPSDKSIIEQTAEHTKTRIQKFWDCENEDNPYRNRFC